MVCRFNDALSLSEDNSFESNEEDFSLMQIQESYIQKNEKYYKLDDGQVYFPNNSQENTFRVLLRSDHNYYVITSYSIHYTKLYEFTDIHVSNIKTGCFGNCPRNNRIRNNFV